jgi:hypothetical protein
MNIYKSHETRNGALCGDLYATTKQPCYLREEGRTDRIYHLCAFGECANPRYEWVNERNVREYKP